MLLQGRKLLSALRPSSGDCQYWQTSGKFEVIPLIKLDEVECSCLFVPVKGYLILFLFILLRNSTNQYFNVLYLIHRFNKVSKTIYELFLPSPPPTLSTSISEPVGQTITNYDPRYSTLWPTGVFEHLYFFAVFFQNIFGDRSAQ